MISVFSSHLITLQEMARYILNEADGNERMLHWLQGIYPCATIADANKEMELMRNLLDARSNAAGHKAINELHMIHISMAAREECKAQDRTEDERSLLPERR